MLARKLLVCSVAMAFIACQPSPQDSSSAPPSPEAAVADVERIFGEYVENWNTPNIDAVIAILAVDIVQMPPDTVILGKAALGADWRQHLEENSDTWTPSIQDIEAAGNLVFIRGSFTETWTPKAGGETEMISGHGMWVFRWDPSGTWRLVLEQWFDTAEGT